MSIRPIESADTVGLVCALLVRFPELASIRSTPGERSVRLTFAIARRLDRAAQRALTDDIEEHVRAFLVMTRDEPDLVKIECESDRSTTFVHVGRDLETFTKEELELLGAFFADRFGEALVRHPVTDDQIDEDPVAADEAALHAVEALRDPDRAKSLVGFREEKRVLVYFLKSAKKAKAARR